MKWRCRIKGIPLWISRFYISNFPTPFDGEIVKRDNRKRYYADSGGMKNRTAFYPIAKVNNASLQAQRSGAHYFYIFRIAWKSCCLVIITNEMLIRVSYAFTIIIIITWTSLHYGLISVEPSVAKHLWIIIMRTSWCIIRFYYCQL